MQHRLDPLEYDLFREQQRKKFLELKFAYETHLDEKDREISRHCTKLERMKRELENKFLIRKELEERLKSIALESEELARQLEELNNACITTFSDLKMDNNNLRQRIGESRAVIQEQDEQQRIELRRLKQSSLDKRRDIVAVAKRRYDELMINFERLRGAKLELKSEISRLRDIDINLRMEFEDRVRVMEQKERHEEDSKYSEEIYNIEIQLREAEKTEAEVNRRVVDQQSDLDHKRINILTTFRRLEEEVNETEYKNSVKRTDLAKLHQTNEEKGFGIMKLKSEIEKLESLRSTFRTELDRMELAYKERSKTSVEIYKIRMDTYEHTRDMQRARILDLEKELREKSLHLQRRKTEMQKIAEVLSASVNREIVNTISLHRLRNIEGEAMAD